MTTAKEVLLAAQESLLGEGPVTDGWNGESVELEDGRLLVTFRWKRLPYLFSVRVDLDDLDRGVWTGEPVSTAEGWVNELAVLLMEEFDTGGVASATRHRPPKTLSGWPATRRPSTPHRRFRRSTTSAAGVIKDSHSPPRARERPPEDTMLLTVDQAAERLGTSVRFIRRLRSEGRIPVVKLGKHIRIDSTDLDQFISASRQEAWNGTRHDGAA